MEKLYQVNIYSKKTDYKLYLLIWAADIGDLLKKMDPITGPCAEYELIKISLYMPDGKELTRPF